MLAPGAHVPRAGDRDVQAHAGLCARRRSDPHGRGSAQQDAGGGAHERAAQKARLDRPQPARSRLRDPGPRHGGLARRRLPVGAGAQHRMERAARRRPPHAGTPADAAARVERPAAAVPVPQPHGQRRTHDVRAEPQPRGPRDPRRHDRHRRGRRARQVRPRAGISREYDRQGARSVFGAAQPRMGPAGRL
ncbi:hypothetical protein KL933_001621 [Ogataea haglerorum]|uniref:Uncharacterized protein n=1 Tax=Ogataea haglerorum TaxID=1937702 RepID=A0AAN6D810_9ASCO|nr:uncharacterized protein KL911_002275 [Ogataea haglerorum]KAG7729395.1 hypothetical protein KL933_001621 [Ogataea haglerorum]KAG7732025.1 hypothetical protein KL948_002223 [Ogataea haglerorum]KAG7754836.1 hypothetical protein KL911_002275 [Ogataea haglerorum]